MADKKYHQFSAGTPTPSQILLIANPTTGAITKVTIQQLIDLLAGITPPPSGTAPSITTQPSGTTITQGQTLNLSVTASGTAPLTYQWQKDNVNISGATSASYSKSNAQTTDSGSYKCIVTNVYGSVTSSSVTVTVNSGVVTYTNALTFVSATSDADSSVNGTVAATNANIKFEFNALVGISGTPISMNIQVGGTLKMVVDYPSDYAGSAFRFTDTTGTTYTSTFLSASGNVNF